MIAVLWFPGARRNGDSGRFPVGKLGAYPEVCVELLLRAGESRRVPLTNDRNNLRMLDMELDISRVKIEEVNFFCTKLDGMLTRGVLTKIDVSCQ